MITVDNSIRQEWTALPEEQRPHTGEACVLRVLAIVDSSDCAGRVIKYLLALHALRVPFRRSPAQRPASLKRLRGYGWFKREEIRDRLINDLR